MIGRKFDREKKDEHDERKKRKREILIKRRDIHLNRENGGHIEKD